MKSVSDTQQNRAVKQALESQESVLGLCDGPSWYLWEGIARLSAGQALGADSATIAYQIGVNFCSGRMSSHARI